MDARTRRYLFGRHAWDGWTRAARIAAAACFGASALGTGLAALMAAAMWAAGEERRVAQAIIDGWMPVGAALAGGAVALLAAGAVRGAALDRRSRRYLDWVCPECGYSLQGLRARACPECGWNR